MEIIFPDSMKELRKGLNLIFILGLLLILILGIFLFLDIPSYFDVNELVFTRIVYLIMAGIVISLIFLLCERMRRVKKILRILSDPRNEEIYSQKLRDDQEWWRQGSFTSKRKVMKILFPDDFFFAQWMGWIAIFYLFLLFGDLIMRFIFFDKISFSFLYFLEVVSSLILFYVHFKMHFFLKRKFEDETRRKEFERILSAK